AGFVHAPVLGSHVPAAWHESLGAHATVVPAQMPLVQTSALLQAFESSQLVPLGFAVLTQAPLAGSQLAAWHESLAVHVTAVPAQVPLVQTSPVLQTLESSQALPLGVAVLTQAPLAGSQLAVWHESLAVHVTAVPAQVPLVQTSP